MEVPFVIRLRVPEVSARAMVAELSRQLWSRELGVRSQGVRLHRGHPEVDIIVTDAIAGAASAQMGVRAPDGHPRWVAPISIQENDPVAAAACVVAFLERWGFTPLCETPAALNESRASPPSAV